jgi:hypothetical protein
MSGNLASDQASYLTSLAAARDAANNVFTAAAISATVNDTAKLKSLMAAVDQTKKAYQDALSESLASDSTFVKNEQTALDQQVQAINNSLTQLKTIDQALQFVNELARLAGSLATAFA